MLLLLLLLFALALVGIAGSRGLRSNAVVALFVALVFCVVFAGGFVVFVGGVDVAVAIVIAGTRGLRPNAPVGGDVVVGGLC